MKLQAHELLVRQGLCSDAEEAKRWIMAGKVVANEHRVEKAGELVPETAAIRIKGMNKYVGKGGYKLEGALSDFGVNVKGQTVLDAGASTGGFTDCLLQHGAKRVYAVDVGHGTLAGKLRNDDRVINLEKTNIGDLAREHLDPAPSFATVDLSYLSLKKAIPIIEKLLARRGCMLCLVKPLFEVADPAARRRGVITDPAAYTNILIDLRRFAEAEGLSPLGITHSHIRGNSGTVEFWLWIGKEAGRNNTPVTNITQTVEAALSLPAWRPGDGESSSPLSLIER